MRYFFAGLMAIAPVSNMTVLAPAAYAQTADERRAQAFYFQSEAALAAGQLDRAEDYRKQAVSLLGSSNAKLAALEVKILFAQRRYSDAKAALDRFYRYDPGPNLTREISAIMVRIDEQVAQERAAIAAAEHAAEEKRLAKLEADRKQQERARRLAELELIGAAVNIAWAKPTAALYNVVPTDIVSWADGRTLAISHEWQNAKADRCIIRIYSASGQILLQTELGDEEKCGAAHAKPDGSAILASTSSYSELFKAGYSVSFWNLSADGKMERIARKKTDENIWHNVTDILPIAGGFFFVGSKDRYYPSKAFDEQQAEFGTLIGSEITLMHLTSQGNHYDSVVALPQQSSLMMAGSFLMVGQVAAGGSYHALVTSVNRYLLTRTKNQTLKLGEKSSHVNNAFAFNDGNVALFAATVNAEDIADTLISIYDPVANKTVSSQFLELDGFRLMKAARHPRGGFILVGYEVASKDAYPMIVRLSEQFEPVWTRKLTNWTGQSFFNVATHPNGDIVVQGRTAFENKTDKTLDRNAVVSRFDLSQVE